MKHTLRLFTSKFWEFSCWLAWIWPIWDNWFLRKFKSWDMDLIISSAFFLSVVDFKRPFVHFGAEFLFFLTYSAAAIILGTMEGTIWSFRTGFICCEEIKDWESPEHQVLSWDDVANWLCGIGSVKWVNIWLLLDAIKLVDIWLWMGSIKWVDIWLLLEVIKWVDIWLLDVGAIKWVDIWLLVGADCIGTWLFEVIWLRRSWLKLKDISFFLKSNFRCKLRQITKFEKVRVEWAADRELREWIQAWKNSREKEALRKRIAASFD